MSVAQKKNKLYNHHKRKMNDIKQKSKIIVSKLISKIHTTFIFSE